MDLKKRNRRLSAYFLIIALGALVYLVSALLLQSRIFTIGGRLLSIVGVALYFIEFALYVRDSLRPEQSESKDNPP